MDGNGTRPSTVGLWGVCGLWDALAIGIASSAGRGRAVAWLWYVRDLGARTRARFGCVGRGEAWAAVSTA